MGTPEAELSSLTPVPLKTGDAMRQVDLVGIESHDAKQMKMGDLENRDASSVARKMRQLSANQKIDGVGICFHLFYYQHLECHPRLRVIRAIFRLGQFRQMSLLQMRRRQTTYKF